MNSADQTTNKLPAAIVKTISYFDLFDYPLTSVEVHKWLYRPELSFSLKEVMTALSENVLGDLVEFYHGYYFLKGRKAIVETRHRRYLLAEKKFAIAKRAAAYLSWVASVETIAVCNNVGYNNADIKSDIDFFIISKKNLLWWTRLAATVITSVLGIRRRGDQVVDKICLSFYAAQNHLNLSDIALRSGDPYLVYWLATLAPIYNQNSYENFLQENNWLKSYLPNFYPTALTARRLIKDTRLKNLSHYLDKLVLNNWLGKILESMAHTLQMKRLKRYFGVDMGQGNPNVVINNSILKLHKTDRRQIYKDAWSRRLEGIKV